MVVMSNHLLIVFIWTIWFVQIYNWFEEASPLNSYFQEFPESPFYDLSINGLIGGCPLVFWEILRVHPFGCRPLNSLELTPICYPIDYLMFQIFICRKSRIETTTWQKLPIKLNKNADESYTKRDGLGIQSVSIIVERIKMCSNYCWY